MPTQLVSALPFWLDHVRMRALARSVELNVERDMVDQTVFSSSAKQYVPGLRSVSMSATAIADVIQGTNPNPPSPADSGVKLVTLGGTSETDGSEIYAFAMRHSSLSWGGAVGDALEVDVEMSAEVSAGGKGLILAPDATRSTSGNGVARQFGALASGQALLFGVHVFAASGTSPTLTVTLQSDDSSGFASPETLASLGPVASPQGLYTVVYGPITDTWYRVTWTIGGTSPSFQFAAVIAA